MIRLLSRNSLAKLKRNPVHAIAMGKNRLITQVAASYLRGYSPFPQNLTFFLTYRCDLRCNVCGQWGLNGYVKNLTKEQMADEVDIDILVKVIDEIAPHRPQITLCGGEVLLFKDWFEFLRTARSRNLTCVLTTNGNFIEQNAERIVDVGLDKLSLSLDGPEEIHNLARGSSKAFRRAIRGIEALNKYKKIKGKNVPVVEIGCTISDQNYGYLDEVVDIAETLNVNCLIFSHLIFLSEDELDRQEKLFRDLFQTESIHWLGYRYRQKGIDTKYLGEKLEQIKSYSRKMTIIIHPDFTKEEINRYYTEPSFVSDSYSNICLAPWTTVYVLPNGDVSPCSSFVAGNIRNDSFENIWNNKIFRRFRMELKKRKSFPACPRCCEFYKW